MCPTHRETKQSKMVGLEQSKIDGRAKQEPAAHAQNHELSDGLLRDIFIDKIRVRGLQGLLTFFLLDDGEVRGVIIGKLVFSLQLPSSTCVKTIPAGELRDIVKCSGREGNQGPYPKDVLLFLDFSSFFSSFPLP